MNAVSLDLVGACLPLALAIGYLPRLVRSLDAWTWMLLVGSLGISATFSFCDSKAVHVVPGIYLLCFVTWLRRGRGQCRRVPAAGIFSATMITIFPGDLYGALTCHAVGIARIGGGGHLDALLLTPLLLSTMHAAVYYFCELDEHRRVPVGSFLRRQFSLFEYSVRIP
ncbi:hypothetical protein [Burkholderia multivorans]|uniref:hypothetical protein n=1 Tax=Burkholderia multivorans TaxID=87883 RepID=UPI001C247FC0|nr:hypothetical protein [Burkholderia multivorans]MBU9212011.1 hypothetical protein [Burkholderia multivorans]MBU9444502.1 hypothetical protein [Burkholderia multivorans]MCA8480108.1 hypothetical protein [Burkholderia multivorans]